MPTQNRLRYDWVLFDADGTLFDYDRAESVALNRAFVQIGARLGSDCLPSYRRINQALWTDLEAGRTTLAILKVRRFELLLSELGVSHSAAEFSDIYLRALADCPELIDGAAEALRALPRHCRAAIVTNGLTAVQRRRVQQSVIAPFIADLIISEEIGCAKPARQFFEIALSRIGNPPKHRILVVGDGWHSDMRGAVEFGLDACWFNPQRVPRSTDLSVTYEISSLGDLSAILATNRTCQVSSI